MTNQQIIAISNGSTRRYWIGSDRRFDRYNRSLVNRIEDLMGHHPSWTGKHSWKRITGEREAILTGRKLQS